MATVAEPVPSLLEHVAAQATPRQLRLFAVACCRLVWDRLPNEASRAAVEVAERFADGLAGVADLDAVRRPAYRVRDADDISKLAADTAKRESRMAAEMAAHVLSYAAREDRTGQLTVLLDVFGNTPFRGIPRPSARSVTVSRDCDVRGNDFRGVSFVPRWRTDAVRGVALAVYVDRDFSAMPVLGDALEESGCDDARVLAHCRSAGPHFRGCWVVDGVLAGAIPGTTPEARSVESRPE